MSRGGSDAAGGVDGAPVAVRIRSRHPLRSAVTGLIPSAHRLPALVSNDNRMNADGKMNHGNPCITRLIRNSAGIATSVCTKRRRKRSTRFSMSYQRAARMST